jgi:DNA (cytosine-5)-methyltransferase 1
MYDINKIIFIENKISKKGNLTYWVKINQNLKRVAKVYFLILKNKGIKDISKDITSITKINLKNRCLGINKTGLKCSNLVFGKYCFHHKKVSSFRFVDLFSGMGSFHYALKRFGGECVLAIDSNKDCNNIYYKNFGVKSEGDILNLSVNDVPLHDILCGGFPCQPFSVAGLQKGFLDKRSNVIWKIFEILKKKNPRFVILENVKGLLNHDNGKTFLTIFNTLKKNSYYVKFKVLNTKVITNIPQNRERLFIVAFKNYTDYLNFDFDFDVKNLLELKSFLELNVPAKYYYNENSKIYGILKKNVVKLIDSGTVYQYRRGLVRENKSKVCPTLVAQMGTGGHNVPIILDSVGIRRLTPRECLRLQGFSNYNISGFSDSFIYRLCGNSITIDVLSLIITRLLQ